MYRISLELFEEIFKKWLKVYYMPNHIEYKEYLKGEFDHGISNPDRLTGYKFKGLCSDLRLAEDLGRMRLLQEAIDV